MLDSFLELSISSQHLLADIGRFEEYGFTAAQTNEVWTHQYGVMSDGACHFGLHDLEYDHCKLSFVVRDLFKKVEAFEQLGVDFDYTSFGESQVHQAEFTDPSGQAVRFVEARTYSPVLVAEEDNLLGQFQHVLLPQDNNEQLWLALQANDDTKIKTDPQCEQLTVVYQNDIEQLVMSGTRNGWNNFSVTKDNHGLIKTKFGFDFLVKE